MSDLSQSNTLLRKAWLLIMAWAGIAALMALAASIDSERLHVTIAAVGFGVVAIGSAVAAWTALFTFRRLSHAA